MALYLLSSYVNVNKNMFTIFIGVGPTFEYSRLLVDFIRPTVPISNGKISIYC